MQHHLYLQVLQLSKKLTRFKNLQIKNVILITSLISVLFQSFPPLTQADESSMLENGRSHFQSGEYYFATTWLERILKNYPATPHRKEVLLMITRAYARSGRNDKAVDYLTMLRKEFPEAAASFESEYRRSNKSNPLQKTVNHAEVSPKDSFVLSTP